MQQFSDDRRGELLSTLPDFWETFYSIQQDCERTRALLRASMEITQLENNGSLPPGPDSARDIAHSSLCAEEYRSQIRNGPYAHLFEHAKVFLHHFCYVTNLDGSGRSLHFHAECHSLSDDVWYAPSPDGCVRYENPVATHVKCSADSCKEFTTTPLLSVDAYEEDIARIYEFGAKLAVGQGEPSFLFYRALQAIREALSRRVLEPSTIGQVLVERDNPTATKLRILTANFGEFGVSMRICDRTWRIEANAVRL